MGGGQCVSESDPLHGGVLVCAGRWWAEGTRHGEGLGQPDGCCRQGGQGRELRRRRQCGHGAVICALAEGGGCVTGRHSGAGGVCDDRW